MFFSHFNNNISQWNTENVTNMNNMFDDASSFNQNISGWNVDKVVHSRNIFRDCPILPEFKPPSFR